MNPSPDRSKECLPPKKRESRQGSTDQPAPEDDFKPPAPFRSRRPHQPTEGPREGGDLLPPVPLPLPWPVSYTPSIHPHTYLPLQLGERRGSWREALCGRGVDGGLEQSVPQHSRWLSSDIPHINMQPLLSVPTFKSVYSGDSREMWSCGLSRPDYSSSLFSPHVFPQPAVYPPDSLPDSRLRYQSRRHNGIDGQDCKSGFSRRVPSCNDYGNDSVSRLDAPHANGRRRQENTSRQTPEKRLPPQVSTSAHSSPWDRDPRGTPKASMPPSPDTKAGKAITSQDHFGGSASPAGAQIYYTLGSLCPSAQQNPQVFPQPRSPLSCSARSSQNQHNSHGVETDWSSPAGPCRPPLAVLMGPDPPPSAVLPHFAKGSLIELAGGHLKRVEELKTEDFLRSADTLPEFHLSSCTILLISPGPTYGFNHLQVLLTDRNTQELLTVLSEYPFFVRDRGWSSCSPQRSAQLYGLQCRQLSTGDVCLALTPTPTHKPNLAPSESRGPPGGSREPPSGTELQNTHRPRKRRWSAPELEPGGQTHTHSPLPQHSHTHH